MNEKCNCGKETRYMHNVNGDQVFSCNKYGVCRTYDELLEINLTLSVENNQLKRHRDEISNAVKILLRGMKK